MNAGREAIEERKPNTSSFGMATKSMVVSAIAIGVRVWRKVQGKPRFRTSSFDDERLECVLPNDRELVS